MWLLRVSLKSDEIWRIQRALGHLERVRKRARGSSQQLSEHFIGLCRQQNLLRLSRHPPPPSPGDPGSANAMPRRFQQENPCGLTSRRDKSCPPIGIRSRPFLRNIPAGCGGDVFPLFSAVYQFSSVLARETRQNFRNTVHRANTSRAGVDL